MISGSSGVYYTDCAARTANSRLFELRAAKLTSLGRILNLPVRWEVPDSFCNRHSTNFFRIKKTSRAVFVAHGRDSVVFRGTRKKGSAVLGKGTRKMSTLQERLRRLRQPTATSSAVARDLHASSYMRQLRPEPVLGPSTTTSIQEEDKPLAPLYFVPSPTPCFAPISPTVSPLGSPVHHDGRETTARDSTCDTSYSSSPSSRGSCHNSNEGGESARADERRWALW